MYVAKGAKKHMGKLVPQFLQLLQLYTLSKVSPGHAFVARPISWKRGKKEKKQMEEILEVVFEGILILT